MAARSVQQVGDQHFTSELLSLLRESLRAARSEARAVSGPVFSLSVKDQIAERLPEPGRSEVARLWPDLAGTDQTWPKLKLGQIRPSLGDSAQIWGAEFGLESAKLGPKWTNVGQSLSSGSVPKLVQFASEIVTPGQFASIPSHPAHHSEPPGVAGRCLSGTLNPRSSCVFSRRRRWRARVHTLRRADRPPCSSPSAHTRTRK